MSREFTGEATLSTVSDSGESWELPLALLSGTYNNIFDSDSWTLSANTTKIFWDGGENSSNIPDFKWAILINTGAFDLQVGVFVGGANELCDGYDLPSGDFAKISGIHYDALFAGETGSIAYQVAGPNALVTRLEARSGASGGSARLILFGAPL